MRRSRWIVLVALLTLAGCLPERVGDEDTEGIAEEDAGSEGPKTGLEAYESQRIRLEGVVRSRQGEPIEGAMVDLRRSQSSVESATTDANGEFTFSDIIRRNAVLVIEAEGHRPARMPVWLRRSLEKQVVTLDPVLLSKRSAADARLLFGGDLSLGRRFLDPEDGGPRDSVPDPHPKAQIDTSDPAPGTRDILQFLRPRLSLVDYTAVNLETVITDDPDTPFPGKRFVFFSLPGSLPALEWAGIDYVGIGNNHLFDYQGEGVAETLQHLDGTRLAYSGAGMDIDAAFEAHRTTIGGARYSLFSGCSVVGFQYPTSYAAEASKAGVASLWKTERLRESIRREHASGHAPIAMLHTGTEYREQPGAETHDRFKLAADAGASLVIAHHPHVAQGVEWPGETFIAHSLGNLAFDQQRLETLRGVLAQVEMKGASPSAP